MNDLRRKIEEYIEVLEKEIDRCTKEAERKLSKNNYYMDMVITARTISDVQNDLIGILNELV